MTPARRGRFLIFCGILLVLLLAAVFRGALLEPLIVLALRQRLGLHATIAQVGGSVLAGLDLREVNSRREPGTGPLVSFEAERITVRYALAALLHGREAFLDSLDVTVEGARLDLDLTGPPAARVQPGERQAGMAPLPRLPRLTVLDSRVRIRGRGFTLEVDGLQGAVARADQTDEQAVDIRVDRLSLRHPALREGTVSLDIAGRYAPRRLAITAAKVNGEPIVERASFDLGGRPGDLDLNLALRLWQGEIGIEVLLRERGTEVRWDARGIDLQPQLLLVNPRLGALRGRLSTAGGVTFGKGGEPTLAGAFSLDWKGALLAGHAVDHLVLQGSAEPGVVRVDLAEGRIGSNEIRVHQASLPAVPLYEGRWHDLLAAASGTFAASLEDLPAFLALWGVRVGGVAAVPDHRLRLEGTLEEGRIRLTRGDLAAGRGRATLTAFTMVFPREDQGWRDTAFGGSAAFDIPSLHDVSALFPLPTLSGSLRGEISGSGTFAHPEGRASLVGRKVSVAGKLLGDLEVQARGTAGEIVIESLQVRQAGSRFTAQEVRFQPATLAAANRSGFFDSLAGSFTLRSTAVPALAALTGIPPGTLTRTPTTHLLTLAGTVRGRTLTVTAGSFAAAGGSAILRAARVVAPGPEADGKKGLLLQGDLDVDIPDLGPIATIFRLPRLQGTLKGRARIAGSVDAPSGSIEASGRGIAIGGHRVGDIAIKASAQRQRLRIDALEVDRGADRLRGRGSFDLEKGTVLEAEADISLEDVAPYLAEFVREGIPVSGRLHVGLRAAGPLPGTPLVIEAQISDGRFGSVAGVRSSAEARVDIQGTLHQPRIGVTFRVTGMSGDSEDRLLRAALDATYEPGRLRIGAFELAGPGDLAVNGEGTLPVDLAADALLSPGPIAFQAQANIPALEDLDFLLPPAYALKGALRADIAVTGSWKEPEGRLEIRGDRLQLPPGTRFLPPGANTLTGTLTWGATEARAEKVRFESPALSCSLSGTWSSPPSLSSLSSLFAGSASAATGSLSLRASVSASDIGWLRQSVEDLRGLHGSLQAEIAVDGPANDPVIAGEISIAAGALRYRNLPPFDAITVRAALARRVVTLNEFGGNVGGSPFTLAGALDFSRWREPVLDLRLQGENALLYRDEGLRIRADSDLSLRGSLSALSLTGEVALTDSLYRKSFSVVRLLSGGENTAKRPTPGLAAISFPRPPLRDMRFDVRFTSREPFEIRTNLVRGTARPDVRLTGTGLLPILRGPIHIDAARVMLPSGILELDRGTVFYRESDPDHPLLDFGGRMQARGYDITLQIGGTFDNPEVILSSIPSLSREELLRFVLTGVPPGSGGADGGSASAMASPMAVYIGKNVLEQILGGGSSSGVQDRIDLRVGREVTRSGSMTVDARLLLEKNPLGHGSALYLTSEKDIYDQYNGGLKVLFKFK